jgi:dienelactone hydrolase
MVRRSLIAFLAACGSAPAAPPAAPAQRPAAAAPTTPAPPATASNPEAIAREVVARLQAHDYKAVAARFDDEMRAGLPADKLEATWQKLASSVGELEGIESATTTDEAGAHVVKLAAQFARARMTLALSIDDRGKITGFGVGPAAWHMPAYAKPDQFVDTPVTIGGDHPLHGILTLPRGAGPFPGVVLVHGSGPSDADETIGAIRVFRDLAVGLASRGIAVLRYDKRTLVDTAGVRTQKDEVDDAAHAAVRLLATTPSIDRKRVALLGHSQGGYLAPRIAKDDPAIRAVILFAGNTRTLQDVLIAQAAHLAPDDAALRVDAEKLKRTVESPALKPDDSVALPIGGTVPGAYFLEVRNYHPAKVAAQLAIPIAVLQGERDFQVTVADDFAAWKAALGKRKTVTFLTYPDANHLFVAGSGPSTPAEYNQPGHVEAKVIDDLAAWINALPK